MTDRNSKGNIGNVNADAANVFRRFGLWNTYHHNVEMLFLINFNPTLIKIEVFGRRSILEIHSVEPLCTSTENSLTRSHVDLQ